MIIVTGATGFIGRRFISQLVEKEENKDDILCLAYNQIESQLEQSGRANLDRLGVKYIPIDLISGEGLSNIPKTEDITHVFHLASITDTGALDHRVNDVGTKNLIEALKPMLSSNTRVVFTSTIALHDNRANYNEPINENTPLPVRSHNEYGRRKMKAVAYLKEQAQQISFSLSIVRVCGVYGEGTREGGLFNVIDTVSKKNGFLSKVPFPAKISIMHVDDMAKMIYYASKITIKSGGNEEYIASSEALSYAEMCQIARQKYNQKLSYYPVPKFVWNIVSFFAKRKKFFEAILPHQLYNRVWQLFLLCSHEFWNEGKKMHQLVEKWKPIKYTDFYKNR